MNKTLRDLLILEMRDIYHAEKQLTRALPKMAKAASAPELRRAFETHLEETRGQVQRLEQAFEALDARTRGKPCEAMQGLIEEAKEMIEEDMPPELTDAALISAAQKVEHYEIASYGTLRTYAEQLGLDDVARLIAETLAEEKHTDELLNELAVSQINPSAIALSRQAAE